MPDVAALGLTAQELADLSAFLLTVPFEDLDLGEPVALFDGATLDGWTWHPQQPNVGRDDVWSVANGVLTCTGRPAGYIRTEADYTDFVLELEWRWPERPGNSGVLLRTVGPDKVWPKSIEAQLNVEKSGGASSLLSRTRP